MEKATRRERSEMPERKDLERDVGIPHSRLDRPEKEPSGRPEGPQTPAHGSEKRGREGQYLRGRRTGLEK